MLKRPPSRRRRGFNETLKSLRAGGNENVSINPDLYDDPAMYGIMLADLAGHAPI
ncbi:MAG: DUF5076 domain-containing protein [Verrucomicrobia bacterium]|nr:DUF5076 domain-containing protein [Verrucomicrobiota bacterium]